MLAAVVNLTLLRKAPWTCLSGKARALLLHKPQFPGVRCAQEQIQVGIEPRTPIVPSIFPVGASEIAHAIAQHLDRTRTVPPRSRIENEIRAALQANCFGGPAFDHGLDLGSFFSARATYKYERRRKTTSLAVRDAAFPQSRSRESRLVITRRIPEPGKW